MRTSLVMYCISSCSKIVGSLLGHSLSNWNYNTFGKVLEKKIGSLRPKIRQLLSRSLTIEIEIAAQVLFWWHFTPMGQKTRMPRLISTTERLFNACQPIGNFSPEKIIEFCWNVKNARRNRGGPTSNSNSWTVRKFVLHSLFVAYLLGILWCK